MYVTQHATTQLFMLMLNAWMLQAGENVTKSETPVMECVDDDAAFEKKAGEVYGDQGSWTYAECRDARHLCNKKESKDWIRPLCKKSCGHESCPTTTTAPTTTTTALADIVDTAVAAGSFKTLAAALTTADLVTTLKGTGPFTVFAPTDDAFGKLLKEMGVSAEELLATPKEELTGVLTYHVASGSVLSTDLSNGMKVTTVNGETLTIKIDGATVMVNDAKVVTADVKASNGVIHIIDKVLVPPKMEDAHDDHDDHDDKDDHDDHDHAITTTAPAEASSVDVAYNSQGLASLTLIGILSAMLFA